MTDKCTACADAEGYCPKHAIQRQVMTAPQCSPLVESVAKAICRAGHDTDEDFQQSWEEHKVGYVIEAGAALAACEFEALVDALTKARNRLVYQRRLGISHEADGELIGEFQSLLDRLEGKAG